MLNMINNYFHLFLFVVICCKFNLAFDGTPLQDEVPVSLLFSMNLKSKKTKTRHKYTSSWGACLNETMFKVFRLLQCNCVYQIEKLIDLPGIYVTDFDSCTVVYIPTSA